MIKFGNKTILMLLVLQYGLHMEGILINNFAILSYDIILYIIYVYMNKTEHFTINIFHLLIMSVPISFEAFTGADYSVLPLSWFNIFALILIVGSIKTKSKYLPWLIFIALWGAIELLMSSGFSNALNQYLNILLFASSFYFSGMLVKGYDYHKYFKTINLVIDGVLAYSIVLLIQYFLVTNGYPIGFFDYMGISRLSIGGTFSDYSFPSLYIMVGIALCISYFKKRKQGIFIKGFEITVLFIASVFVNARTGLISFIIAGGVVFLVTFFNTKYRKLKIILVIITIPIIFILLDFISTSRGQGILDDSGRIETYISGLRAFGSNILFGIGLGIGNYRIITSQTIPHNIIIQYLAQTGIVFTVMILTPLFNIIYKGMKSKSSLFFPILTMLIGGMFIPDLINSRFIIIYVCLWHIHQKVNEDQSIKESKGDGVYERN